MRRPFRFAVVAALLLAGWRAEAYWGPTHEEINKQVANSKPFDLTRAGVPIRSLEEYLQVVLFIGDGLKHEAKGVPFRNTGESATKGRGAGCRSSTPQRAGLAILPHRDAESARGKGSILARGTNRPYS